MYKIIRYISCFNPSKDVIIPPISPMDVSSIGTKTKPTKTKTIEETFEESKIHIDSHNFDKKDYLEQNLLHQTNDIPLTKLQGTFNCKVVDVYDGDTCTIVLINKGSYEKHKLRMYGYDSPEMKPLLKLKNREEIKAAAVIAKEFLYNSVRDKICVFDSMGTDKYGRLLGILWCENININELMLVNKQGYPYKGGKKR